MVETNNGSSSVIVAIIRDSYLFLPITNNLTLLCKVYNFSPQGRLQLGATSHHLLVNNATNTMQ